MKSAGKARNNGLYRHIRTSKEIIRNLLNDYIKNEKAYVPFFIKTIRLAKRKATYAFCLLGNFRNYLEIIYIGEKMQLK